MGKPPVQAGASTMPARAIVGSQGHSPTKPSMCTHGLPGAGSKLSGVFLRRTGVSCSGSVEIHITAGGRPVCPASMAQRSGAAVGSARRVPIAAPRLCRTARWADRALQAHLPAFCAVENADRLLLLRPDFEACIVRALHLQNERKERHCRISGLEVSDPDRRVDLAPGLEASSRDDVPRDDFCCAESPGVTPRQPWPR